MKRWGRRALRLTAFAMVAAAAPAVAAVVAEPRPWQLGMQPPATPVLEQLSAFHDELLVIIFLIAGFVIALLLYVICALQSSAKSGAVAHDAQSLA